MFNAAKKFLASENGSLSAEVMLLAPAIFAFALGAPDALKHRVTNGELWNLTRIEVGATQKVSLRPKDVSDLSYADRKSLSQLGRALNTFVNTGR